LLDGFLLDPFSSFKDCLAAPEPDAEETAKVQPRRKRREGAVNETGLRFDESVPVRVIEVAPAPEVAAGEIIDYKRTFRLARRRASFEVLEYRCPVVKPRGGETLTSTPAPANLFEGSLADVSFLAGLLVDKFVYHLPLYRQHQRLRQSGIELSRMTLTNLARRAIDLLEPIYDAQLDHIRRSRVIAMDETPIKAGRQAKGKLRQGYFWPIYGEADEIAFSYSSSRAAKQVREVLGDDFTGTLISDGYEAYAHSARQCPTMTHAQCWAHTRRYFERAKEAEPEAVAQALQSIGTLYHHEATIREKGLCGEAKLKYRTQHSGPVVAAFWRWCEAQCRRHDLLPSHPLTKALQYARSRTEALRVFLSDPEVPVDTNHLERALRPIPMGRKSWLFCWTELGAKQVGIIQSLLVTCKLHGIHPMTYLIDVLQRIDRHPASEIIELTPRVWKKHFADNPLRSDLDAHA